MKRSEINAVRREAAACFGRHGWVLPPAPRWDITDFGLGHFARSGLVLITLADTPEYCEKLMYARARQMTPLHAHRRKKEDIICRFGRLAFQLWPGPPAASERGRAMVVLRNGANFTVAADTPFIIEAGERITVVPGIYHAFWPESPVCIIGEVSTANDDANDNSEFRAGFNTPENKFTLGIGNRKLTKNLGFNVTYRWQDEFLWQSDFGSAMIPEFGVMDAQVSYKVSSIKTMVKIGGSNLIGGDYRTNFGGPFVGQQYYISLTFDEFLK